MEIDVVWGAAEAPTELSAFDAALAEAGVHNYNLLQLSSVVPADATVVEAGRHEQSVPTGTPVSVVLAERSSSTAGETLAAGLGWATSPSGGVFMEATGDSEAEVRAELRASLEGAKELREWEWREETLCVRGHTVEDTGSVVVAAVYPGFRVPWIHDD